MMNSGRKRGATRQLVRGQDGAALLCAWDDCQDQGDNRVRVVMREGTKERPVNITAVFCKDFHRALWLNAHRAQGNVATGERGPLGLPLGITR